MQDEVGCLISAYFAIRFPTFTYYVKTLSCTIGRRSSPGNRDDLVPVHVDIDLGPLKSVSRLHARIEYDEDRDGFVLCVLGRNGAWVEGDWVKSGGKVLLRPKTTIQIASRSFQFLVAPAPAHPDASTSVISIRSTEPEPSPRTDVDGAEDMIDVDGLDDIPTLPSKRKAKTLAKLRPSAKSSSAKGTKTVKRKSRSCSPSSSAAPSTVEDLDVRIQLALQKQSLAQSSSSILPLAADTPRNATSTIKVRLPIRVAAITMSDIPPIPPTSLRPSNSFKQPPIVFKNGELILNERIFKHLSPNQLRELSKLDPTDISELLQVEVRRFYKEEMRAQKLQQGGSSQGRISNGKGTPKVAPTRRLGSSAALPAEGISYTVQHSGTPAGLGTSELHGYQPQPSSSASTHIYPSNSMLSPFTAPQPTSSLLGHGHTPVYHPHPHVAHYVPQHYYSPYPPYSFPLRYQPQPPPHPLSHSHQPHNQVQASIFPPRGVHLPFPHSEPPLSEFDAVSESKIRGPASFRSVAAPPEKHGSHGDQSDRDAGKRPEND